MVVTHRYRRLEASAPDFVNTFDDLLDSGAMRSLQSLEALWSILNMVRDDLHDFLAWPTEEYHDSCWYGGAGPASLDRTVRKAQRSQQGNKISSRVRISPRSGELFASDFEALLLYLQDIRLGFACLCASHSLYEAYTETLVLVKARCSMYNKHGSCHIRCSGFGRFHVSLFDRSVSRE